MKRLIKPGKHNNYTPFLLHRSALAIYVLIIFVFNLVVGQLGLFTVFAAVDASTLYSLHNSNRNNSGLGGLTVNSQLVSSATSKAKAMLDSNCWDHYCPPGTSPWSFILGAGYEYIYAGENLAEGFGDNNALMNAWMNSPTHRANVLNGNFTEIGIGFAYGSFQGKENNTIVVVHFGSRQKIQTAPPAPVKQITTNTNTNQPKPTSVSTPVPTNIPNIEISSPKPGDIFNSSQPEIVGNKPETSILEININEQNVGRVEVRGTNFSFRPPSLDEGDNVLKVLGYINERLVNQTVEIEFKIDTVAPPIDQDKIEIITNSDSTELTILIKDDPDIFKISSNINSDGFSKVENGDWEISFSIDKITDETVIIITAEDEAGNQTILEIPASEILGISDKSMLLRSERTQTFISGPLFAGLFTGGVAGKVNLIFILFLTILFAFDFYFIHKSGLTGIRKSKSHLHLSALTILVLVLFLGGFGGSIL